jgi:hypothetical protein
MFNPENVLTNSKQCIAIRRWGRKPGKKKKKKKKASRHHRQQSIHKTLLFSI